VDAGSVWPSADGKVELIDLASGSTIHTTTGNKNPYVGVDRVHGRVLVPQAKTLHILSLNAQTSSR
jgi:hypothetical protein